MNALQPHAHFSVRFRDLRRGSSIRDIKPRVECCPFALRSFYRADEIENFMVFLLLHEYMRPIYVSLDSLFPIFNKTFTSGRAAPHIRITHAATVITRTTRYVRKRANLILVVHKAPANEILVQARIFT